MCRTDSVRDNDKYPQRLKFQTDESVRKIELGRCRAVGKVHPVLKYHHGEHFLIMGERLAEQTGRMNFPVFEIRFIHQADDFYGILKVTVQIALTDKCGNAFESKRLKRLQFRCLNKVPPWGIRAGKQPFCLIER